VPSSIKLVTQDLSAYELVAMRVACEKHVHAMDSFINTLKVLRSCDCERAAPDRFCDVDVQQFTLFL
jgi:hypothetical protein